MRKRVCADAVMMAMMLTACQKNPVSSIVVNKDMDKLIEEAGKDGTNVSDAAGNYNIYQTTLSDESLGVTVNVDAKVDIPQTEQMSVFRVKCQTISQDFLSQAIQELAPGEQLYDAAKTTEMRTRSEIEAEISSEKASIEEMRNQCTEEDFEVYQAEGQQIINELQEEYENAPIEVLWEGNESDGLLHRTAELHEQNSSNEFYEWMYSLNQNGEAYYGINDGKSGTYTSFYVQNNEERGNCFRFCRGTHGHIFLPYAYVSSSNLYGVRTADSEGTPEILGIGGSEGDMEEFTDEAATISLAEARTMAEAFLEKMGLDTYQYYEGGLYNECEDIRKSDIQGYRKVYILRYMRNIDGTFTIYSGSSKYEEGWSDNSYVKKEWPEECVEIYVNDSGIVGVNYNAPLEIMETVVEKSNLKTFDEVKETFEKMVLVANAQADAEEGLHKTIQIDRVVLGYARISEADSYDTGLLVPVWDFEGTAATTYEGSGSDKDNAYTNAGSILTINAIDGSIIDHTLGY